MTDACVLPGASGEMIYKSFTFSLSQTDMLIQRPACVIGYDEIPTTENIIATTTEDLDD